VSVSTEIADFLFVDRSDEARHSISLNGVGNGGPVILGRRPMVVSSLNASGEQTFMVDPAGVLISKQSKLRILGQQKMKKFGFHVVQCFETKEDNLIYKNEIKIPLTTINGILMVKTEPWCLDALQMEKLNKLIDRDDDDSKEDHCFSLNDLNCVIVSSDQNLLNKVRSEPVLIINEANLSKTECARLDHWRFSHRTSTERRYEERCHTCEQSKHKSVYKLNDAYHGTSTATHEPYWRLYGDAYGGQKSMGSLSYQGGIGGFVFVCPISGKIKAKLYSSQDRFPAILFHFLDVETEGYTVRELYCHTNAVNISAAAEEVAGIFKVKNNTYVI
jgi:hypothetical protein